LRVCILTGQSTETYGISLLPGGHRGGAPAASHFL
jgi:hypothetical protein